jgi:hypothetical protein
VLELNRALLAPIMLFVCRALPRMGTGRLGRARASKNCKSRTTGGPRPCPCGRRAVAAILNP